MSPAPILDRLGMRSVSLAGLDLVLGEPEAAALTILFLWGVNCPNCDIAKAEMALAPHRFLWRDLRWLQCNVYDEPAMATRFGLHGIPVFLVFRGRRPIGRITSWPGADAFVQAIETQRARPDAAGGGDAR